jgi:hypothetical protein
MDHDTRDIQSEYNPFMFVPKKAAHMEVLRVKQVCAGGGEWDSPAAQTHASGRRRTHVPSLVELQP